jgi:hypothetical protein
MLFQESRLIYFAPPTAPSTSPGSRPKMPPEKLHSLNISAFITEPVANFELKNILPNRVTVEDVIEHYETFVQTLGPEHHSWNSGGVELSDLDFKFQSTMQMDDRFKDVKLHLLTKKTIEKLLFIYLKTFYGLDFDKPIELPLHFSTKYPHYIKDSQAVAAYTVNEANRIEEKHFDLFRQFSFHVSSQNLDAHKLTIDSEITKEKYSALTPYEKALFAKRLFKLYLLYLKSPVRLRSPIRGGYISIKSNRVINTRYVSDEIVPTEEIKKFYSSSPVIETRKILIKLFSTFYNPTHTQTLAAPITQIDLNDIRTDRKVASNHPLSRKFAANIKEFQEDPAAFRQKHHYGTHNFNTDRRKAIQFDVYEYSNMFIRRLQDAIAEGSKREFFKNAKRVRYGRNSMSMHTYLMGIVNGNIKPSEDITDNGKFAGALKVLDKASYIYFQALSADPKNQNRADFANAFVRLANEYPGIPENQDKSQVIESSTMLGAKITQLIRVMANNRYGRYTYYELLRFSHVEHCLLVSDPTCRMMFMNLLLDHELTPENKKILQSYRLGLDLPLSTILASPAKTRMLNVYKQMLAGFRGLIQSHNDLSKQDVKANPFAALTSKALRELDTASGSEFFIAAGGVYTLSQFMFSDKNPKITGAFTLALTPVLASMFIKDDKLWEVSAALQKNYLSTSHDKLYKALKINPKNEGKFLPFILKNFMTMPEFSSMTIAELRSFVDGTGSDSFLSGDSILMKALRAEGPGSDFMKKFKVVLRSVLNRADEVIVKASSKKLSASRNKRRTKAEIKKLINSSAISDYMFMWFSVDPVFREFIDSYSVSPVSRTVEHPQLEPTNVETLTSYHQKFISTLKGSKSGEVQMVSDRVKGITDDEEFISSYNFKLSAADSIANISQHYGELYHHSTKQITYHKQQLQGVPKLSRDAMGNVYTTIKVPNTNIADNKEGWENRAAINKAAFEAFRKQLHTQGVNIDKGQICISFNASYSNKTNLDKGSIFIGLTVAPTIGNSDLQTTVAPGALIADIKASPIESSVVADNFNVFAEAGRRSPVIRVLEELAGVEKSLHINNSLITSPLEKVYSALTDAYAGVSAVKSRVKTFIKAFKENQEANAPYSEQILSALVNYIQHGPGTTTQKEAAIKKLSESSGAQLYYKILQYTYSSPTTAVTKNERAKAFGMMKTLDDHMEEVLTNNEFGKLATLQKDFLRSAMQYLIVLMGYIFSDMRNTNTVHYKIAEHLGIASIFNRSRDQVVPGLLKFLKHKLLLTIKQNFPEVLPQRFKPKAKSIGAIQANAPEEFKKEILLQDHGKTTTQFVNEHLGRAPRRVSLEGDNLTALSTPGDLKGLLIKQGSKITGLEFTSPVYTATATEADFTEVKPAGYFLANKDTILLPKEQADDTLKFDLSKLTKIDGDVAALQRLNTAPEAIPSSDTPANLAALAKAFGDDFKNLKPGEEAFYLDNINGAPDTAVFLANTFNLDQKIEYVFLLTDNTKDVLNHARNAHKRKRNIVLVVPTDPKNYTINMLTNTQAHLNTMFSNNYTARSQVNQLSSTVTVAAGTNSASVLHTLDSETVKTLKYLGPTQAAPLKTNVNKIRQSKVQIFLTEPSNSTGLTEKGQIKSIEVSTSNPMKAF